jgi:glycosyltransferase involved in cell wall biosynthesis
MAMGKPIVVTKVPGISDYIRPGENCLATPSGDGNVIAHSVMEIISNSDLSERLSKTAREDALTLYGEERMAKDILDFIRVIHREF